MPPAPIGNAGITKWDAEERLVTYFVITWRRPAAGLKSLTKLAVARISASITMSSVGDVDIVYYVGVCVCVCVCVLRVSEVVCFGEGAGANILARFAVSSLPLLFFHSLCAVKC